MSNERKQSKLDELLRELCPDGVEYRSIGNCTEKVKKIKWSTCGSNYAYIDLTSVDRDTHKITETQTINANNAPSRAQQIVLKNDVLFATTRPTLMRYCLIEDKYDGQICSTGFCVLRANKDIVFPKWLFHVISSSEFCYYMEANQKGASYPAISDKEVMQFKIPLPPLPVQREIVRILDKFTELIAELTAELTARKKQYGYYRNKLLSFENETSMQALGDVCDVVAGGTPSKKNSDYWNGGTIKWLGSTVCQNRKTVDDVTDYITEQGLAESSAKVMKAGSTLIALVGATIGKTAYLPFEAAINQNIAGIYPKDTTMLDPSYVYYACTTLYSKFLALTQGSKLAMANISFVRSLQIPIPSLQVQKRLVQVLDHFDAICSDLKIGLPAEIEARKKQYEFYREKLLAFHEISN